MTSGSSASSSSRKNKPDTRSASYVSKTFFAGGIAGSVAKTVVAPLDRVKILFQASNPDYLKYSGSWTGLMQAMGEIRRRDGLRGLFQGHSATLLRIFPYAAIKFVAYDQAHNLLMPTRADETNFLRFVAGAVSGTSSVFLVYPLDVLRVRLAFNTHATSRPTLLQTMRIIYNEGAVINKSSSTSSLSSTSTSTPTSSSSATRIPTSSILYRFPILQFYRGFGTTLIGMVPYAGTSFLVWGNLRARFLAPPRSSSSSSSTDKPPSRPVADFAIGAISGGIAQTVSYPFEVIRRRMQVGGLIRPDRWVGFLETVRNVYNTPYVNGNGSSGVGRIMGWRGFFVGLTIGYVKVVPMTAVSFATWEAMKRAMDL